MEIILIDVNCRLLGNEVLEADTIVLDLSRDFEAAGGAVELPCERLEQRGLAAARRPQEKRQPRGLDDAADTVEDADPGVLTVEAQHAESRLQLLIGFIHPFIDLQ